MPVGKSLPLSVDFLEAGLEAEDYVESLLSFITSCDLFQNLCGGVHILDFLTKEPDLYSTILPQEWREWLQSHDLPDILDLFLRESSLKIGNMISVGGGTPLDQHGNILGWRNGLFPPTSLLKYIHSIRRHALNRTFVEYDRRQKLEAIETSSRLPRHVAVGMKPKKIHEVQNFVKYIDDLAADVDSSRSYKITHIVDFGSGQTYLGRALASPPYSKKVVALESKQLNINGAKSMDVTAKLAGKERIMRNKKQYRKDLDKKEDQASDINPFNGHNHAENLPQPCNLSCQSPEITGGSGDGNIQYIETLIENGDLSKVVSQIKAASRSFGSIDTPHPQLLVVSLHSCGNLLHHGLRSLLLNPAVKAVAMVGCCHNLVTERLGPPTYKLNSLRSFNLRLSQTSSACDPHGFPMSEKLATYPHQRGNGIRLNITARMMAVQAPENWSTSDCESFFTRHFYRALLQRILLDRGIVKEPTDYDARDTSPCGWTEAGPPLTIGSLRKGCYTSFAAYVRGATAKLVGNPERGPEIARLMKDLTDEDIESYEEKYKIKKKELSIIWSLMALSAGVVESTIVVDRWLYLKEQEEVKDCWVETVFDYLQSPRNLVVVGIKH